MNDLILSYAINYASLGIMIICNLIFVIVICKQKKLPGSPIFIVYGMLTLLQDSMALFAASTPLIVFVIYIVAYVETFAFYTFLHYFIKKGPFKRRLPALGAIFTVVTIAVIIIAYAAGLTNREVWIVQNYYVVLCSFINLASALYYIYHLAVFPSTISLTQHSSFWMSIGILLLSAVEIPTFLITNYLQENAFYWTYVWCNAANYLAYSFMFICLTISCLKAKYLTKITTTTTVNSAEIQGSGEKNVKLCCFSHSQNLGTP